MTTPTTHPPGAQWRVPLWAYVPVAAAMAAEATSNALRAYGLGSHLDAFTVTLHGHSLSLSGAVLVLAAVAVSLSQTRAAWVALTPSGPARQRIVAAALALLLLAISVSAMASHILEAQRAKSGGESQDRTAYAAAKAAYTAAKADFDRLGPVRSTAEVKAAMENVRIARWAWDESAECTAERATLRPEVAKACSPFYTLRIEMAAAISRADAADRLDDATAAMAETTPVDEATEDEAIVSRLWGWIMGLGVVLLATFGPVIFARVEQVPAADRQPNVHPDIPAASNSPSGASDAEIVALRAVFLNSDRPDNSPDNPPAGPKPGARVIPLRPRGRTDGRADVLSAIRRELSAGRTYPSQRDLCRTFRVPRSTMSDWLAAWETDGTIPPRRTVGRCKAVG